MPALAFALVMLGCSDAGDACQTLQASQATYATRAECTARIDDALMSDAAMRADHPTVIARCESRRASAPSANRQGRALIALRGNP
ncbi:MAG: hypothetical protein ACKOPO_11115 [Novosphingobium sp.]